MSVSRGVADDRTHPRTATIQGRLPSGRPFSLTVPEDLDSTDALGLVEAIPQIYRKMQEQLALKQGALVLPNGGVLPLPKN